MKAMKGLSVNKVLGSIKRKTGNNSNPAPPLASATTAAENPETTAHNSVKAFCESGGNVQSDEVLFLPPIVDAAESSPAAAAECARVIRKYLGKDYYSRPSWQYNAIMLVRILTNYPGQIFTRNLDEKFVETTRSLLKNGKDAGVQQLLMETLDNFVRTKTHDGGLGPMIVMWNKEKEKAKASGGRMPPIGPRPPFASSALPASPRSQDYFAKSHSNHRLPSATELASRLEEARTSAKLLEQVVKNTPPGDMPQNDLMREFANRCLSASRSIQGYMVSESPAPDNDTMENLIDTNEQLQTALSQHQRAMLSARKQLGLGATTDDTLSPPLESGPDRSRGNQAAPYSPSGAAVGAYVSGGNGKGKQAELQVPGYDPSTGRPIRHGSSSRSSYSPGDERGETNPFEDSLSDQRDDQTRKFGQRSSGYYDSRASTVGDKNTAPNLSMPITSPPSLPPSVPPPPPPAPARSGAGDFTNDDMYGATPKSKRSVSRF